MAKIFIHQKWVRVREKGKLFFFFEGIISQLETLKWEIVCAKKKKKKLSKLFFSYIISQLFIEWNMEQKILLLHFRRWNILDSHSDLLSLLHPPGRHMVSGQQCTSRPISVPPHIWLPHPDSTISLLSGYITYSEYLTI